MKKGLLLLVLLVCSASQAQVYTMQNGTVSTCSGTFYDSGGASGTYGSSENYQMTFCPATPGTYIQLNFNNFETEGFPFDYMRIYNGIGTGGTLIGTYGTQSPMCDSVIASSDPSGCLTVTFVSDGSLQYGGWSAQVVCSNVAGGVPPPGGPPNTVCSGANPFCADAGALQFPNTSGGCAANTPAIVTSNTCLALAPNPAWYFLEIGIPGNLNLEIEQTTGPNGTGTGIDVDYAIWGPFANAAATCSSFASGGCFADHSCYGSVVDCSYSDQPIENATIPNAQVGQIYVVLITNFDGAPGFISMTQTNAGNAGSGSTNCSIVCPTVLGINPTTCGATDGSIRISGLDPNTTYTVTYLDDGIPISLSVNSNAAGTATVTGLNAGNYTNIKTNFAGCSSVASTATLTASTAPALTNVTNNTSVCSGGNAVFNLVGTPNATVTYQINSGGNQTVGLNSGGTATVTVNAVTAMTTMAITAISLPGCMVAAANSSTVSVNPSAAMSLNSAPATTGQTLCINTPITNITYLVAAGATGATVTGLPSGVTGSFSSGLFTISGTPTASGIFSYTVTTTGSCSSVSLSGTISVNPSAAISLNSAPATTTQALCINTPITNITYLVAAGATGATVTGLPPGVSGSFSSGLFTISGTPTISGVFSYTVTTTGSCSSVSLSGTISVNPSAAMSLNSAPATTGQTLCINTPITNITYLVAAGATGATVTGLPSGVTGSFSSGLFTISGTPTISGVFSYMVTTTGSCSNVSSSGMISVNPSAAMLLNSAPATTGQALCINTPITNITYLVATAATVTGLPPGVTGSFSSGLFTISGTPTASGIFSYTVTTTGSCSSVSLSGTISVNPSAAMSLNSAPATTDQTLCINTPITNITYLAAAGATGATVTGLPPGVTGSLSSGLFTISGTPIASGIFSYMITTTGSCSSVSLSGTISVNPSAAMSLNSAPATTGQTLCINTPITNITYLVAAGATGATVTGLPPGVTRSFSSGLFTISGIPTTSGIFSYTVTTTGSCSNVSLSGTISVNPSAAMSLNSAPATTGQTLCINSPITNITYLAAAGATGATATGLPPGVTGNFSSGLFTISGTAISSGNFNYAVTTSGGCGTVTSHGIITVNADAAIALDSGSDNQNLCINLPISNITYTVTNGGTGATVLGLPTGISGVFNSGIFTISGSPTVSGTFHYTVTATGSSCSSPSLSGTIVVQPDAMLTQISTAAIANQTLCIDTPIAAIVYGVTDGAATATGLPTGVTGNFVSGIFTISGTPTVSGTFPFSVATSGGCTSAVLNGVLTVQPNAAIALTSGSTTAHQVLCINTPIIPVVYTIVNATGAVVTGLPAGINASYASGMLTISGASSVSGEFDFTVVTTGGCATASALGSFSVNANAVIALDSAIALTNQVVCVNSAIQPIVYHISSGGSGAAITGLPTGLSGNFASGQFTISGVPTQSGIFPYNVITTGGCSTDTETGTITVSALATATLNYPGNPYCTTLSTAQPVVLSGTGFYTGGSFSSTTGLEIDGTTGSIIPSSSTPGNYVVEYLVPASGGCAAIPIYTSVTITKVPTAAIGYASPFCTGINALQAVALSGTAAYSGGLFSASSGLNINPSTGAINPALSVPGNYTVTYHTPANSGCNPVPATANVVINATPIAITTPVLHTICSEETTNIAFASLAPGTNFTWTVVQNNVSGASNGSGALIAQRLETINNTIGTAVYTIVPSTAFCTGDPITVTVTVNPLPFPSLAGGVICRNQVTGIVMRTYTLNAGLNNTDYDFVWSRNTAIISGASDNIYVADEPGIYTVVATNTHTGCSSYPVNTVVSESEIAEAAVISGNDAFVEDPVITVTVLGSGTYEYQLDAGNFQTSNVFANLNIGEHVMYIRDADGCTDIAKKFTLIGYPKFFTPNNDGHNDRWNIFSLSDQKESHISIFDRYGKLIKQISPAAEGWDGTCNGYPLPSSDYWFSVQYFDQQIRKEFKAHFSLKR